MRSGFVEQQCGPDARRQVPAVQHAVAIETRPVLRKPARRRLHAILREQRDVRAVDRLERRSAEVEAARERSVGAVNQHGTADARAVVLTVQHVDAHLEQMQSSGTVGRRRQRFNPLRRRRRPLLHVVEVAGARVGPQRHRRTAHRAHLGAIPVHLHRRWYRSTTRAR